jgi:uncharacterized protein YndB with AHSA1/START domain
MNRADYQPGPAAQVHLREDDGRWTLVFERELRHKAQSVWEELTQPSHLREWAPFDADRDLGSIGAAELAMAGSGGSEVFPTSVRQAEPPSLLEYTWGEGLLRWELEPTSAGTRLTLRHTLDEKTWIPKVAAGWHLCLDVAERALAGEPMGRIVGKEARRFGWDRLNDAYAAQLGIENTGWPEGMPTDD